MLQKINIQSFELSIFVIPAIKILAILKGKEAQPNSVDENDVILENVSFHKHGALIDLFS